MIEAVIEDGAVVNTILWDGESGWNAEEHQEVIEVGGDSQGGIGWTHSGGVFIPPPEPEDATPVQEV